MEGEKRLMDAIMVTALSAVLVRTIPIRSEITAIEIHKMTLCIYLKVT